MRIACVSLSCCGRCAHFPHFFSADDMMVTSHQYALFFFREHSTATFRVCAYLVFCVKVEIVDSIQMCSTQFLTTTHQKFHIISQKCQKHWRKLLWEERLRCKRVAVSTVLKFPWKKTYFCSAYIRARGKVRVLTLNCNGLWNFRNILCCWKILCCVNMFFVFCFTFLAYDY